MAEPVIRFRDVSKAFRRAVQMVIYGRARKIPRVHWTFTHIPSSGSGAGRKRGEEPELPLNAP